MALIGQLIKTALELKQTLQADPNDIYPIQQSQLLQLLDQAKDTALGKYYNFERILKSSNPIETYQNQVPIYDYQTINTRWWKQQQMHPDISWPGTPNYFALSSGTTGKKSKRIPVTQAMLDSFRAVGISQATSLANFNLSAELFEKEILMLGSSVDLTERNGHLEGEISGINASNLPPWFGGFYRPGKEIAAIDNWDERVDRIAAEAPKWDVGAIAGIPSWVEMMLEKILEKNKRKHIHELWPNLSLYVSGGVAFEPYRKSFNNLLGQPIEYLDTYLASEGFFAFTARPDTMNMRLALQHGIFYEFIPFDERGFDTQGNLLDDPLTLTIKQVEEDQDYALLVSTPAGAWRYMIGDTIKFTNLNLYEIVISGRTKYFLNVVGSQLSEEKINQAIQELSDQHGLNIKEFAVSAIQNEDGSFKHQWIIGNVSSGKDEELAQSLDQILKQLNKNYNVARNKALHNIEVCSVPEEQIYSWLEEKKKKGGQIKLPRVMKAEMMQDFLASSQMMI